ncbi:MAG: hypothetical protein EHM86_00270 [Desulfobulbaceae bacterium]|nr:MAG: hypothetical protein EHM86_00270 [Desulfobulbaceae bacterium]
MKFEELKAAVLDLDLSDQKRLLLEVMGEIMPKVCTDDIFLSKIGKFIDEEVVRTYKEQHMNGI